MRLTQKDQAGEWFVPLAGPDGKITTAKTIFDRLAAYENTGLEPEEIKEPALWVGMSLFILPEEETDWLKSGECTVESIHVGRDRVTLWVKAEDGFTWPVQKEEMGVTVFRTKEEAAKARGRKVC